MQVGPLGEETSPYVLDCTPNVLNVEHRCGMHGYDFHWDPYWYHPYYTIPDGYNIPLRVANFWAHLDDQDLVVQVGAPAAPELCIAGGSKDYVPATISEGSETAHNTSPLLHASTEKRSGPGPSAGAEDLGGKGRTENALEKQGKPIEHQMSHEPKSPVGGVLQD